MPRVKRSSGEARRPARRAQEFARKTRADEWLRRLGGSGRLKKQGK